jgi:hypothetical protein
MNASPGRDGWSNVGEKNGEPVEKKNGQLGPETVQDVSKDCLFLGVMLHSDKDGRTFLLVGWWWARTQPPRVTDPPIAHPPDSSPEWQRLVQQTVGGFRTYVVGEQRGWRTIVALREAISSLSTGRTRLWDRV